MGCDWSIRNGAKLNGSMYFMGLLTVNKKSALKENRERNRKAPLKIFRVSPQKLGKSTSFSPVDVFTLNCVYLNHQTYWIES